MFKFREWLKYFFSRQRYAVYWGEERLFLAHLPDKAQIHPYSTLGQGATRYENLRPEDFAKAGEIVRSFAPYTTYSRYILVVTQESNSGDFLHLQVLFNRFNYVMYTPVSQFVANLIPGKLTGKKTIFVYRTKGKYHIALTFIGGVFQSKELPNDLSDNEFSKFVESYKEEIGNWNPNEMLESIPRQEDRAECHRQWRANPISEEVWWFYERRPSNLPNSVKPVLVDEKNFMQLADKYLMAVIYKTKWKD